MAQVLSLYKGTTEVMNLLSGVMQLRYPGSWGTQMGRPGEPLTEVMELVGRSTTDALLLAGIYDVQDWLIDAADYVSNNSRDAPCYLRYQPDGASAALQSLVLGGRLQLPAESKLTPLLGKDGHAVARLELDRLPYWEALTGSTATTSALSTFGGKWTPSLSRGDLPSRISKIKIYGNADDSLDNFWIGIRPTYEGTSAFVAKWEAEAGTNGTDATDTADATASGSTRVSVSFATAGMVERMRISVDQVVGANYNHFVGRYLVLGRIKVSSPTTRVQIELHQGLRRGEISLIGSVAAGDSIRDGFTEYAAADWQIVELGSLQIPPAGHRITADTGLEVYVRDTTLYVYAQRTAGSGQLYLDCFFLVPTEPVIVIKNADILGTSDFTQVENTIAGDSQGVSYESGATDYGLAYHGSNGPMVWPKDDGMVILVAEKTALGKLVTPVDVEIYTAPRYSLIRE